MKVRIGVGARDRATERPDSREIRAAQSRDKRRSFQINEDQL